MRVWHFLVPVCLPLHDWITPHSNHQSLHWKFILKKLVKDSIYFWVLEWRIVNIENPPRMKNVNKKLLIKRNGEKRGKRVVYSFSRNTQKTHQHVFQKSNRNPNYTVHTFLLLFHYPIRVSYLSLTLCLRSSVQVWISIQKLLTKI